MENNLSYSPEQRFKSTLERDLRVQKDVFNSELIKIISDHIENKYLQKFKEVKTLTELESLEKEMLRYVNALVTIKNERFLNSNNKKYVLGISQWPWG